jgi:hypothetical protein
MQQNLFHDSDSQEITFEYILRADNNWKQFKSLYGNQLRPVIIDEVEKMLKCCTSQNGFATYICLYCGETKTIPFSCKSKICSCCGKKHTQIWSEELNDVLLNVPHKHIVFTVSDRLWSHFQDNSKLQKLLLDTAADVLKKIFSQHNRKKVKITPGLILVLHPFGDDLKANFHVHIIITTGGLSNKNEWVYINDYIDYSIYRNMWQYAILTNLRKSLPKDPNLNRIIDWCFSNYKNGFVIQAKRTIKGGKRISTLTYIARYVRHPAISNRRIIGYDGQSVTFIYKENKKKYTKTLPKFEFIKAVVQHIPDKQFKMVRRVGLYSRRSNAKYEIAKQLLEPATKEEISKFNWRRNVTNYTGKDPLRCNKCGNEMVVCKITYFDKYGNRKTIGGLDWSWLENELYKRDLIEVQNVSILEKKVKEQSPQNQGRQLCLW